MEDDAGAVSDALVSEAAPGEVPHPTASTPLAAGLLDARPPAARAKVNNPFHDSTYAMMFFKVLPCPKATAHDWTACPYSHSGEAARRRCLLVQKYSAKVCPEMQARGVCPRGQACHMTHGLFEFFMHPVKYKTKMCRSGEACKRHYCFFCHDESELRKGTDVPAEWTVELSATPGAGLSPESVMRVLACLPPAATPAAQAALQQLPYVLAARDSEQRGHVLQLPLQQQQQLMSGQLHHLALPGLVGQMQQLSLGFSAGGGDGGMDGPLPVTHQGPAGISTPQGLGNMPGLAMYLQQQHQAQQQPQQQQQHVTMLVPASGMGAAAAAASQPGMLVQLMDGGGGQQLAYAAAPTSAAAGAAMQPGGLVQLQDGGYVMVHAQASYPQQFQQQQPQQQLISPAHMQDAGALVPAHLQHAQALTSMPLAVHLGAPVMPQEGFQQQQLLVAGQPSPQQQQAPGVYVMGTPYPGTAN